MMSIKSDKSFNHLQELLKQAEDTFLQFTKNGSNLLALYSDLAKLLEEMEQTRILSPHDLPNIILLDNYDVYELAVAVAYSLGYDDMAFEYAEKSRARNLLDRTLNKTALDSRKLKDNDLLRSEIDIKNQISTISFKLQSLNLTSINKRDINVEFNSSPIFNSDEIVKMENELSQLRRDLLEVEKSIQQLDPAFAAVRGIVPASKGDVQALIDESTAVLAYFITEERLITFIITSNEFWTEHINLPHSQLGDMVRQYRKEIQEYSSNPREVILDQTTTEAQLFTVGTDQNPDFSMKDISRQLYDILIQPIESHLIGKHNLCIIPDKELNFLPFDALQDATDYLIRKYSIWYAPSASFFDLCNRRQRQNNFNGKLLAIGNPKLYDQIQELPYAEDEIYAIAPLFDTKLYTGRDANLGILKDEWGRSDILHLACHAHWDQDHPEFSALLLSPNEKDNGRLEARELYEIDHELSWSMVTLSACNTSLATGNDLTGLTSGFLYAGAASVVSSLWAVDDLSTSEFMINFYNGLVNNSRLDALRQAKLALLHSNTHSHPYFWAAFKLIGNHLPISHKPNKTVSAFNFMHQWAYKSQTGYFTFPLASNGIIFVSWSPSNNESSDLENENRSEIWAISIQDKEIVWKHQFTSWARCINISSGIVHVNGTSSISALNALTGELIWEHPTDTLLTQQLIMHKDLLITGGYSQTVYAFNAENGTIIWQYKLPRAGSGGFLVEGNTVQVGCNDHSTIVLNCDDGLLIEKRDLGWDLWTAEKKNNDSVVCSIDNISFVCQRENYSSHVHLDVFDSKSGVLLRRYWLGRNFVTSICRNDALIIVGDGDGVLQAFSLEKTQYPTI